MCPAPHKGETPEFVRGESPPRTDPRGRWRVGGTTKGIPGPSGGSIPRTRANPAAAQIRRTDSGVQWSGALPPPAANVARRKAGGSRGAQHPPCQSAMFNIACAGLTTLTVVQASRANARKTLRRAARNGGSPTRRGQAPWPLGRWPHGREVRKRPRHPRRRGRSPARPSSALPLPLGDRRSSILGHPMARRLPEQPPDRPETALARM